MAEYKYQLIMDESFKGNKINPQYWFPFYLPQWSSRVASAPSYKVINEILQLYIAPDQKAWCPEWNGIVRVSNLQTGVFSGPKGSSIGQHHFVEGLVVREEQEKEIKIALHYGKVEFRAKCNLHGGNVAALWLIGLEEDREHSAEICLFELKGNQVRKNESIIGYGLHPFGDSSLSECFFEELQSIDVTEWNVFELDWKPEQIDFYINGKRVKSVIQVPHYPMQLMLNLYDIEDNENVDGIFEIDYIKVSQLIE